jgi:hypothetical protein
MMYDRYSFYLDRASRRAIVPAGVIVQWFEVEHHLELRERRWQQARVARCPKCRMAVVLAVRVPRERLERRNIPLGPNVDEILSQ